MYFASYEYVDESRVTANEDLPPEFADVSGEFSSNDEAKAFFLSKQTDDIFCMCIFKDSDNPGDGFDEFQIIYDNYENEVVTDFVDAGDLHD